MPVLALLALTCWAVACGDGATEPPPPPPDPPRATEVRVTPATASLTALGATVQLAARVLDQNGQPMTGAAVAWSSGNASVATVNASGLVTAAGNGSATITATSGAASESAAVTVAQMVGAVTITPAADTLVARGDTVRLTAEASDANGHAVASAEFAWSSGDTAVATVDASGLVTSIGVGDAAITATSSGVTGAAHLRVRGFTLSGTVRDARVGEGLAIHGAVVRLEDGTQEPVTTDREGRYRLSDVAGTVKLTVTADPSYLEQTVEVTVDSDRTLDFVVEHTGIPPFSYSTVSGIWDGQAARTANILDASDPTSLRSVTYAGRGERRIDDRRTGGQITVDAYLFAARYDGPELEFRVNPEFGGVEAAETEVMKYAPAIGRLPAVLLSRARLVDINAGDLGFGGNSRSGRFLIHTGRGERNLRAGLLEEVLLHEGGHISLDPTHANAPDWRAAQQADGVFVSEYARDYPDREDVAESIVAYFAVRYRPERLSEADRAAILAAIPNRLAYFDRQGFDMSPYTPATHSPPDPPRATEVTVTPATAWLTALDETVRFSAEVRDQAGRVMEGVPVSWSSADTAVAAVDSTGLVTAAGNGTATITATAGSARGIARITVANPNHAPPYFGTTSLDPDIIMPSDPTDFVDLEPAGRGERSVFDRRRGAFVTIHAYLFDATFAHGLSAEFQVNPEFGTWTKAEAVARAYAPVIGQIPVALREDVDAVWIHRGDEPFGGGSSRALLVHTDRGDKYRQWGILSETLVHEAVHASLDWTHRNAPGWLAAQAADPTFISTYARDHPEREDLAESFSAWLAVRHRRDRITEGMADTITSAIPHRLAYFDSLRLDLCPVTGESCEARRIDMAWAADFVARQHVVDVMNVGVRVDPNCTADCERKLFPGDGRRDLAGIKEVTVTGIDMSMTNPGQGDYPEQFSDGRVAVRRGSAGSADRVP